MVGGILGPYDDYEITDVKIMEKAGELHLLHNPLATDVKHIEEMNNTISNPYCQCFNFRHDIGNC
jgi:hypothetical protein